MPRIGKKKKKSGFKVVPDLPMTRIKSSVGDDIHLISNVPHLRPKLNRDKKARASSAHSRISLSSSKRSMSASS